MRLSHQLGHVAGVVLLGYDLRELGHLLLSNQSVATVLETIIWGRGMLFESKLLKLQLVLFVVGLATWISR